MRDVDKFNFVKILMMLKTKIVSTVGALCRLMVDDLQTQWNMYHANSDLDEGDTKDPDDFSQQTESTEMARHLEGMLAQSRQRLAQFESIPFSKTHEVVEPGALVTTSKHILLVGVAVSAFESDEGTVVGISTQAPIYKQLAGKKAGDVVEFHGESIEITAIA
jgi:transcription elongation GreA/GreB family factor